MNTKTPDPALQRTAPGVTAPACACAMQVPRRALRSLGLGSPGAFSMRIQMLIVLTLTAAFCGCAKSASREDELRLLRTILPDALLDCASLDVAAIENVAAIGEGQGKHLGLHLLPGQRKLHKGVRAEVSVDYPFAIGETVRYSWRFMLPKDFVSDAPKNRWWVIGQWHDQPNKKEG